MAISHIKISADFFDNVLIKMLKLRLGEEGISCFLRLVFWDAKQAEDMYRSIPVDCLGMIIEETVDWRGESGIFFKTVCDLGVFYPETGVYIEPDLISYEVC